MMNTKTKTAKLYRMVMPKHICPYGIKSKDLLQKQGYQVDDHHLTTKDETEAFKAKHSVKTTPQTFIDGQRIGGYDDLRVHFGIGVNPGQTTYRPIIAIFLTTFLMAVGLRYPILSTADLVGLVETFVALSMCVLAIQKLQDLEAFSLRFVGYDLLARRYVNYSYFYPFAEAFAGVGMLAGVCMPASASVSLFIGLVGAISVFKAVYIEKRELKCACVGGDSQVPLGFVSLTENLMMIAMGLVILSRGN